MSEFNDTPDNKPDMELTTSQPQPMLDRPVWHKALHYAGVAIVAGGAFALLTTMFPSRTSGATRSSKLKFEQRQKQIETACVRQDAEESNAKGQQ